MRTIRAVIFDLDGLLVDSEPLQKWAWEEYVRRFDAMLTSEIFNQMLGRRNADAVLTVIEALDLPVTPEDALRDRDAIFLAAVPGAIHPRDGAHELIGELKRRGIPIALATSGHRRYVNLALASAGLTGLFDAEITAEQVERGKPHPDVYLAAARALGVPPEASLALEDAPNGVRAAKAAGMTCFAIPGKDGDEHDFSMADATLQSLDQVINRLPSRAEAPGTCS